MRKFFVFLSFCFVQAQSPQGMWRVGQLVITPEDIKDAEGLCDGIIKDSNMPDAVFIALFISSFVQKQLQSGASQEQMDELCANFMNMSAVFQHLISMNNDYDTEASNLVWANLLQSKMVMLREVFVDVANFGGDKKACLAATRKLKAEILANAITWNEAATQSHREFCEPHGVVGWVFLDAFYGNKMTVEGQLLKDVQAESVIIIEEPNGYALMLIEKEADADDKNRMLQQLISLGLAAANISVFMTDFETVVVKKN